MSSFGRFLSHVIVTVGWSLSSSVGMELTVFVLNYQVHTLLKGLEKIAASADIPMLVCGDFNSIPGRSVVLNSFLLPPFQVEDTTWP